MRSGKGVPYEPSAYLKSVVYMITLNSRFIFIFINKYYGQVEENERSLINTSISISRNHCL